jgi:hypothetical protein
MIPTDNPDLSCPGDAAGPVFVGLLFLSAFLPTHAVRDYACATSIQSVPMFLAPENWVGRRA